ncbi:hypothetical protein B5F07_15635 [Lachnoclostridium sp. An169]|uniref:DUF4367 domain-containing protein n=1 Tax=Lachnoclostridium sp. An169 TaxID=1965569 RepID=UPI000B38A0AC|nr:DUF4367 domain-containing protein [Lachnoclostridium sp. An169]OUP82020.1 hypothetical protein B5F07_15635 [Lachnoclostridium sp. An169]HJA65681.1 DUF4367 domain-containing protein [Candidatus Mediterraneibacter cottocaccae]
MKDLKKLSLKEEIDREADEIEKEIMSRDDLDDIKFSEDMETSLFNRIQEYEFDKREKKVHYKRKKKRYLIFALAAVIVLVCGSVMTGVGSKSYWKVLWDRVVGDENLSYVDVENMESKTTEDFDEINVYREINEKLGINMVRFLYKPVDMELIRYAIDEDQRRAFLYYGYEDEVIRFSAYLNDDDSSFVQKEVDMLTDKYNIDVGKDNSIEIVVEEYEIKGTNSKRYIGEFKYKDVYYQLKGVMQKNEFEQILKNLQFF